MMTDAIRDSLSQLGNSEACQNPGLALERYRKGQACGTLTQDEQKQAAEFWNSVTGCSASRIYGDALARWRSILGSVSDGAFCKLKVTDRLIVGLGAESVLETGITMNRVYGVPVIPGAALKGLARHYFLTVIAGKSTVTELDGSHKEHFDTLFGTTAASGCVTFFDAWYVPAEKDNMPLRLDVMTPHHPEYYSKKGEKRPPPTDFDDPNPVSFISAVGSYLVAVQGPGQEWSDFTLKLLRMALADWGVGSKTSSGYGRLKPEAECRHLQAQKTMNSVDRKNRAVDQAVDRQRKKQPLEQPKPVQSAPPQSYGMTKEIVSIVSSKPGKETVKTKNGEVIPCPNFPPWQQANQFHAEVSRENGKAVSARFRKWS